MTVSAKMAVEQNLVPGLYYVTLAVMNEAATTALRYMPKVASFKVKQQSQVQGVALMPYEWEFNAKSEDK
jgi:transcription antitermination factor NusG